MERGVRTEVGGCLNGKGCPCLWSWKVGSPQWKGESGRGRGNSSVERDFLDLVRGGGGGSLNEKGPPNSACWMQPQAAGFGRGSSPGLFIASSQKNEEVGARDEMPTPVYPSCHYPLSDRAAWIMQCKPSWGPRVQMSINSASQNKVRFVQRGGAAERGRRLQIRSK